MIDVAPPRGLRHWIRDLATYDVLPAFSAKVRRTIYTPLLSLMAFCSFSCGLFVHPQRAGDCLRRFHRPGAQAVLRNLLRSATPKHCRR